MLEARTVAATIGRAMAGRPLVLAHFVHDGVLLEEKACRSVLRYAAYLWGYGVKLLEIEAATDKALKTYEAGAVEAK